MGGITEIKALIKSGLENNRTDKESSIADFNKAKSIAEEQNLHKEIPLIESYIKIYIENDFDNAKSLLDKYQETKDAQLLGYFYFLLGKIYDQKGDYDNAIEFYQKALDTPGYDTPGYALNNMGLIYFNKGAYDRAAEFFQKALDTPSYDTPGTSINNMGLVYDQKGDYDKAIAFYQKALDSPGYDTPGMALNNMGVAYYNKGEINRAVDLYQKALDTPGYVTPGMALNNMGVVYRELKKYEEALECHKKALKSKDIVKNESNKIYTQSLIKSVENSIKNQKKIEELEKSSLSEEIEKSSISEEIRKIKSETKEQDVLTKIFESFGDADARDKFFKEIEENQKKLDEFITASESINKNENLLYILRRFNSYTPIVSSYSNISKGGGYFITCDSKGIVIDPGFNFIQNFFDNKLRISDIDKIIITHAHNDHTVDLESIITLIYLYNKKLEEDIGKEEIKTKRKRVDLYLNAGTFKKYGGWLSLEREEIDKIYILNPSDEINITSNLKLKVTKAKHNEIIDDEYCVGLIFSYGDNNIIFTSDTEWNDDIGSQYKNFKNALLIPHMGTVTRKEADYLDGKPLNECVYSNHLGLIGVTKMIAAVTPQLTVISEFGEEIKDRVKICDKIESVFKSKIIPADIGLKISLEDYSIYCYCCDGFASYDEIKARQYPVSNNFKIYYHCKGHDDEKARNSMDELMKT